MAQEIDTKNLAIVPKDQIVYKSDNDAFVKRILEILLAKDKKHDQKIDALSQAFQQLMANLRNEVNGLFVSDRVKKIEDTHNERVKAIDEKLTKADARISELKDGYTPVKGMDYFDGEPGLGGSPDSSEMVRDKLASLQGEDRLDKSAIKGLDELDKDIKGLKNRPFGGGGISQAAARDLFVEIDITGELDGSTKEFNIPAVWRIISVELSSYPHGSLRNEVHYSYTPTKIIFLDPIDETSQLKSDQHCKILAIRA